MSRENHYLRQIQATDEKIQPLRQKLVTVAAIRLIVFIAIIAGVAFLWQWKLWAVVVAVSGLTMFLWLVNHYQGLQKQLAFWKAKKELFEIEVKVEMGNWREFDGGEAAVIPAHPYASDLHILGKNSLFQYLNRTQTQEGKKLLATWLGKNITDIEVINKEKDLIGALATDEEWIFDWLAQARLSELHNFASHETPLPKSVEWKYKSYVSAIILYLIPILTTGAGILYLAGILAGEIFVLFIFLPLIISAIGFKKNQATFEYVAKHEAQVEAYRHLLFKLQAEKSNVAGVSYLFYKNTLSEADKALRQLGKVINSINQRNNMIMGVVLNIFLLWDLQCLKRLNVWQQRFSSKVMDWYSVVWKTDAYLSFALFTANHPDFCAAVLTTSADWKFKEMAHPLMKSDVRVPNDFSFSGGQQFSIITGANMAGKSTFLRTVGVNMVLAMRGLPVCASHFEFCPRQIFTSMLTIDSLGDNESYFFSELKRLRQIMDELEKGVPLFLILDEILKGTNSVDKAKGSEDFLKNLMRYPVRGIIATHDLSLCRLRDHFPQKIFNTKFEVELINNKLVFDYKLQPGICENMNATFLLRKMGLSGNDFSLLE